MVFPEDDLVRVPVITTAAAVLRPPLALLCALGAVVRLFKEQNPVKAIIST